MLALYLLACPVLSLQAPTAARIEGLATVDASLAEIRQVMASGQWKKAKDQILDLLDEADLEDALVARWPWISDALVTSTFWKAYKTPKPKDVVPEIVSWKERSGDLKLIYRRGSRGLSEAVDGAGDFIAARSSEGEESGFFVHPIRFTGPYRIEVRGRRLENAPTFFLDWVWGSLKGLGFGTSYLAMCNRGRSMILSLEDGQLDLLDYDDTHLKKGERYSFDVRVSSGTISLAYNGKRQVRSKRSKGPYGQFGLSDLDRYDEVEISGEVEPAWITGLVQSAVLDALTDFREKYEPLEDAPKRIRERVEGSAPSHREFGAIWPGEPDGDIEDILVKVTGYYDEGEFEKGLKYVRDLDADDTDEVLHDWMLANFLILTGDTDAGYEAIVRVAQAAPEFYEARLYETWLCRSRVSEADSRALHEELRIDFPKHVEPHEGLALLHLFSGQLDAAENVLAVAATDGFPMEALQDVGTTLLRKRAGPNWPNASRYASKNYVVHSNAGKTFCSRVATQLEKTLRAYQRLLGRVEDKGEPKFPVYFFAGEAGYKDYCRDLLGTPADNTLGIFHPALKQLLVWDSPNPGSTMRTVRHEGFHQFFDRLVGDSPVWLNEGIAEYYEQARFVEGRWEDDQINVEHVALLMAMKNNWTPLDTFIHQDDRAFRAKSGLHYAQGWAFVHFMCNGGREPKKIFDRLIDGLKAGLSNDEAIAAAFQDVNLPNLEREFRAYVHKLR